jgi:hypothetical protein
MLIICLLEKYVRSTKKQLLIVSALWLSTIMLWVFDTPMKLGQLFSQYLLVFMIGFWIKKLGIYEKIMNFKMAFLVIPLIAFFAVDFSGLFSYSNKFATFEGMLYINARIIIFSLALVLLSLLLLKKIKIQQSSFIKKIASMSAFIYLTEPFISFLLLTYLFADDAVYFADGTEFYLFQVTRVVVLLVLLPLAFIGGKKLIQKRASAQPTVLPR